MNNPFHLAEIERRLLAMVDELGLSTPLRDTSMALADLGLDSLSLVHLREMIVEDFGLEIPAGLLAGELGTIRKCAEYLAARHERPSRLAIEQGADR